MASEQFHQFPKTSKVLIIDNLQDIRTHSDIRHDVFRSIEQHFGVVILIGEHGFCVEEIYRGGRNASAFANYTRYDICEFGYVLLDRLTRRWLSLGSSGDIESDHDTEENVRQVIRQVEQVLKSNAIPHHPWILLALLQNVDTPQGPVAKNGSYGHLVEAVITFALDTSKYRKIDIKGKYNVLSEYAYELYFANEASLDTVAIAAFFRKYRKKYEVILDESRLCEDLIEVGLLSSTDADLRGAALAVA